jgi:hypothetical protein
MSRAGADSTPKYVALALAVVLAGLPSRVAAQERPAEDDIFGGAGTAPTQALDAATATATATAPTTGTASDSRDELNLSDPRAATRFSAEVAPEDPLKIGGQFYWRVMSTGRETQYPQNWGLSAPALLDVYLDARPNDRVRAFALGRMSYDPTLAPNGTDASSTGASTGVAPQSSDSIAGTSARGTRGPSMALDQLWLRFDLLRRVFVTAGKQHVRWGTARFWAPTDYLHLQARNPLLPFDPRTGTTMLKLHLPWEEKGWNFYAYALPESASTTTLTPADVAGALRTEIVLGTFEAGVGVFGQRNSKAKFAADLSFGLWELDFYGEAAVRNAGDVDFVSFRRAQLAEIQDSNPPQLQDTTTGQVIDPSKAGALVDAFFPVRRGSGWKPQVTGGVSYTRLYAGKDTFTVGAEYFYNGLGYSDAMVYPGILILQHSAPLSNPATYFYLGKHYLAVFATAPAPYSWDRTTFSLSTLANLSDKSGITRLDFSLNMLTHLRFEAYGAVHWGQRNGEFRLGIDGKALGDSVEIVRAMADRLSFPPALFSLGMGVRVAL